MTSWATASTKSSNPDKLSPEIQLLANEFKLVEGELFMASKPFKAWLKRGQAVPATMRERYAEDLLVLAAKFYEYGGESVARAVAQLFALAADVMGKTIQEQR